MIEIPPLVIDTPPIDDPIDDPVEDPTLLPTTKVEVPEPNPGEESPEKVYIDLQSTDDDRYYQQYVNICRPVWWT